MNLKLNLKKSIKLNCTHKFREKILLYLKFQSTARLHILLITLTFVPFNLLFFSEHGLTVENILKTSDEKLGQLIYPVGFWKTKVKFVKEACQVLKDEYDCDIPRTVKDLCNLKGKKKDLRIEKLKKEQS